jgi:hypothetical protein
MSRVARIHPILWLVPLGVAPALLLDLVRIGPDATGVWPPLMVMALWLGFPYYMVEAVIGLLGNIHGPPSAALHVASAVVATLLLVLADRAFVRLLSRRRADVGNRAI